MLRIVTTFLVLSILGIALSGVAAFGAAAKGAGRASRWVSVDSAASLRCGTTLETAGQSHLAVGATGGTSRVVYGFLACDGSERQLGMDIFVVRADGGFELTVRDHDSGETVVRRLHSARPTDFALSGLRLRFTVAEQTDPPTS
jgi:hypothetical protein